MTDLIKRTYRIRKDQDKQVKKAAMKNYISESQVIREAIDEKMQRQ